MPILQNETALLILDIQIAPFAREKFDGVKLYEGQKLLENISLLITKARLQNIPIIYTRHTGPENTALAEGKPAWGIHPAIKPLDSDIVLNKYHVDPFFDTRLDEKLKSLGINTLIIAGIKTELAVDTACRAAYSLGYKNILVSDGHSTFDSGVLSASQIIQHHNDLIGGQAQFKDMAFAEVRKAEEIFPSICI